MLRRPAGRFDARRAWRRSPSCTGRCARTTAGMWVRNDASDFQRTSRRKLMPQMRLSSWNRIDRNGMRNSIVQPPSKSAARVSQMAFQSAVAFSLVTCEIAHAALRVGEEGVPVAPVVERVEQDREMVVVVQVGRVAAHVARHALRRIALPQPGADVDGVVVDRPPRLRSCRWRAGLRAVPAGRSR